LGRKGRWFKIKSSWNINNKLQTIVKLLKSMISWMTTCSNRSFSVAAEKYSDLVVA